MEQQRIYQTKPLRAQMDISPLERNIEIYQNNIDRCLYHSKEELFLYLVE